MVTADRLTDAALAAQAREVMGEEAVELDPEYRSRVERDIREALCAVRDAATAAERERACLILEKLRNERGEHSFSAIVLDQALAALRGGDHD